MPVKSPPKERPLIEMFLSAYEYDTWKDAGLDWVGERQDGAVEVVATRADGATLALEHTLIQPFVGEKFDSERFMRAFGLIEKNPALIIPERNLDVIIPVGAIPNGYVWEEIGKDLLSWLIANHAAAPEGYSAHAVTVGISKPLTLNIGLQCTSLPGMSGSCLIARDKMPKDLGVNVEKALRTKLPKLVKTQAPDVCSYSSGIRSDWATTRSMRKSPGWLPRFLISTGSMKSGSSTRRSTNPRAGYTLHWWMAVASWNY